MFAVQEGRDGAIDKATFFVTVQNRDEQNRQEVYALDAVTTRGYRAWELEEDFEALAQEEIFPLVVTEERLGPDSLIDFMQRRYLTIQSPTAINDIRQFLFGPIKL